MIIIGNYLLVFRLQFDHGRISPNQQSEYPFLVVVGSVVDSRPALFVSQQSIGVVSQETGDGVERSTTDGKMKRSWS